MSVISETIPAGGKTSGYQLQSSSASPRPVMVILSGFVSGTAAIEVSHEDVDASYVPMLDSAGAALSYAVDGAIGIDVPPGAWVRVNGEVGLDVIFFRNYDA